MASPICNITDVTSCGGNLNGKCELFKGDYHCICEINRNPVTT